MFFPTAFTIKCVITGVNSARRVVTVVAAGGLAAVVFASSALAETDSVRFEYGENGTWTVPDGVTEIEVEVAGAGGGGTNNTTNDADNSGGDGALVSATVAATPGEDLTIGVGGGGTGRSDYGGGGGGGGASIVTGTDLLVIAGGGGGAGVSGDGGDAGGTNGRGGNGGPSGQAFGKGGYNGTGGKTNHWHPTFLFNGNDYDPGNPNDDGEGYGGAAVGGAGSTFQSYNQGGLGGAGYGGGAAGTYGGVGYSRGGGAGGSTAQGTTVDSLTITYSAEGGAGGFGNQAGGNGWIVITWIVPRRATQASGTPTENESPTVTIQLRMPTGMACSGLEQDPSNAWVRLPTHAACSAQDTRSSEVSTPSPESSTTLLGWATTPDFPRDIAQRQVDKGWGTYELTDDDGNLSAIFIPAGGWAGAQTDINLHPIWSE